MFMEPWLTDAQLLKLTGFVQTAARVRWLQRNKVRHFVNAENEVIVLRSDLESRSPAKPEPRFQALRHTG